MKGWENNASLLFETGNPGKCPRCGNSAVEVELWRFGRHLSLFLKCSKCGDWEHLDGRYDEESCKNVEGIIIDKTDALKDVKNISHLY